MFESGTDTDTDEDQDQNQKPAKPQERPSRRKLRAKTPLRDDTLVGSTILVFVAGDIKGSYEWREFTVRRIEGKEVTLATAQGQSETPRSTTRCRSLKLLPASMPGRCMRQQALEPADQQSAESQMPAGKGLYTNRG
jgi:hypothetical protein